MVVKNRVAENRVAPTYRDLLTQATQTLYDCSETPRIDAEYLMQHTIEQSMGWLISYGNTFATADHTKAFLKIIEKRAEGIPVAYLMGYRDFWTLRLKVNQHVLIPRGDTEVLVEQALDRIDPSGQLRILDMGTGSGAIALSIAKERPNCQVVASDKHHSALEVARGNAKSNKIENIEFILSDWFEAFDSKNSKDSVAIGLQNSQSKSFNRKPFDLIASNPPYIEPNDPHLTKGDLRFEPNTALVSDDCGLSDLIQIIQDAPNYLNENGWLLLEHGFNQANDVEEILNNNGFTNIRLYSDLNHLPRCTAAQLRVTT